MTSAREWSMRRTSDRTLSLTSWKAPWCHWGWLDSLLKAWGAESDWVKRRLSRASRNERGAITSLGFTDSVQECRELFLLWLKCEHVLLQQQDDEELVSHGWSSRNVTHCAWDSMAVNVNNDFPRMSLNDYRNDDLDSIPFLYSRSGWPGLFYIFILIY